MRLDRDRPEILTPPEHPQACCPQQTLTGPPQVTAKTRQKHDYPSAGHRRSYARRTGAERGFATALLVARSQRILVAWNARQQENARRAAAGLPPKTRRRRRKTLTALTATRPP